MLLLRLHRWHREWDRNEGGCVPALSNWSRSRACLPRPLQSGTARWLGALSAAMCAAGRQARCTWRLPPRGAINYNPICSTNSCSPDCRILHWLPDWQGGQLSRPRLSHSRAVRGRKTYGPTAATSSCGWWTGPCAEMAATTATALLEKRPVREQPASGGHRLRSLSLVVYQERGEVTPAIQANGGNHKNTREGKTELSRHNWACVAAGLRQAFSFRLSFLYRTEPLRTTCRSFSFTAAKWFSSVP